MLTQGMSATNVTNALEEVRDHVESDDSKQFSGDLAKKLYIAEKHIRKNKLKVQAPPLALLVFGEWKGCPSPLLSNLLPRCIVETKLH